MMGAARIEDGTEKGKNHTHTHTRRNRENIVRDGCGCRVCVDDVDGQKRKGGKRK